MSTGDRSTPFDEAPAGEASETRRGGRRETFISSEGHTNVSVSIQDLALNFLLQRHQTLSTSVVVTPIVGRILNLVLVIFVASSGSHVAVSAPATVVASALVSLAWLFRIRSDSRELASIEEAIFRRTGGELEDYYIGTRDYLRYVSSPVRFFPRIEIQTWFLINFATAASLILQSLR